MLANAPPTILVVDLDGTLTYADTLHESAVALLRQRPLEVLLLPLWLIKGKANLKSKLASRVELDIESLPYNLELIEWLREEKKAGRRIVLATATDESIAKKIADFLGLFDEVVASDGLVNNAGRNKKHSLDSRFGLGCYAYAGNSTADLPVWEGAAEAIVVNASDAVSRRASDIAKISRVFSRRANGLIALAKACRIHQWLKNLLLFVPLIASHQMDNEGHLLTLVLAFISFSSCASAVYITNDLLDLESDRRHPRKCNRPFASGALPVYKGVLLAPILFLLSCGVGVYVGPDFLQWLLIYFVLTCIYSVKLKQLVLVDCMTLAILYTLRIVAGAAAVASAMSFWLLAFSVFLFLSLAFIKRFAELQVLLLQGRHEAHGRGYFTDDAPLIQMLGIASGFMSVLILALYLNSPEVLLLYAQSEWVWGNIPVMVFWISWLWLRAHRGEMHDDPLIFAVNDKVSLVSGVLFAGFLLLGSLQP